MLCAKCKYEKIGVPTYEWLVNLIINYEPKNQKEKEHKERLLKVFEEEEEFFKHIKNKIKLLEEKINKLEVR